MMELWFEIDKDLFFDEIFFCVVMLEVVFEGRDEMIVFEFDGILL